MSDAGKSGNIKGSFVDDENKVDIEATSVNFGCIKNEPNEEALNFEEDSYAIQYRITLKYENIFGESSRQIKIEEDSDNLIGFLDNDVIMENAMIKLEAIKEEEDGSFNNFYCSKCKGIYKGYCFKCSTLLCILNNSTFVNSKSELNTIPVDILEIRETSRGKGVYLLRTLPINIIFGPFEGVLAIESTVGHSWKITDSKLRNIKSLNWMKNIVCAPTASLKNLDIFQIDGNLYFQTNREITEGEELLAYYDDEKLQQLDNNEDCLYTPQKQEKLPKIFACTICCLGFGSNKCLIEHKRKCCWMEHSRNMKDFVLVECHYCKMWMEKWEHEEYHVAYCLEKYHRMWSGHSEAVHRSDADVEEMEEGDCGTRAGKRRYRGDICSRPKYRRDDLQLETKDYPCFSGRNHETRLNDYTLAERSNEKIQNTIETNNKSRFQNYLNKHRDIKPFTCDICLKKFTRKDSLKVHIKNKHTDDGNAKAYKCSECLYRTNDKPSLQKHLNKHMGIKPFECDICMMKFGQKIQLKTHVRNKHTDDGGVRDYKCSECNYQTNYKSNFQSHINNHKGIKPYKCSECNYQTNNKDSFQRHQNKHNGIKPFECDICLMKFAQKGNLNTHIKNKHTDDGSSKVYKCSECNYQTNYKNSLQRHQNKHKGIKPFECDICLMKFAQKGNLKTHIRNKHTDDASSKDYQCSECSYQTNDKDDFQRHLNKRRCVKRFTCDICKSKFFHKVGLAKHIKDKHADDGTSKDYQCSECFYQTNEKYHFQRHQNKHRGIKPFTCNICAMKFGQKTQLKTHIKNKHNDDGM